MLSLPRDNGNVVYRKPWVGFLPGRCKVERPNDKKPLNAQLLARNGERLGTRFGQNGGLGLQRQAVKW